jgi:nitrite reductase (NO-forming)
LVGGPNFTSSFHVIGEIFDKVHHLGGVTSEPLGGIQTVMVPVGGAVITEFKVDVPGNYTLVDHALARAERGLVGILHVEGDRRTPRSSTARLSRDRDTKERGPAKSNVEQACP